MNQQQAMALAMFINRALPHVHMTFAEAQALGPVFAVIESMANGLSPASTSEESKAEPGSPG